MYNTKWKFDPPRARKMEGQYFFAAIVTDEENSRSVVYSTNKDMLLHIIKLHNALLEKPKENKK